jgi:hypothetical protein
MNWITDTIAIGNYLDAQDKELLQREGILSVLSLDGSLMGRSPEEVGVKRVVALKFQDGPGNDPALFLRTVDAFCWSSRPHRFSSTVTLGVAAPSFSLRPILSEQEASRLRRRCDSSHQRGKPRSPPVLKPYCGVCERPRLSAVASSTNPNTFTDFRRILIAVSGTGSRPEAFLLRFTSRRILSI